MNVILVSNIASHYRESVWLRLLESKEPTIKIYTGFDNKYGIKTIDISTEPIKSHSTSFGEIKNIYLGKLIIWQKGILSIFIKGRFDYAILLGDMYIISTWLLILICRYKKIPTALWGHGLYGNESAIKLFLRKTFYSLADKHLVYEKHAKKLMINQGFTCNDIYIVFNSLNYELHKSLRNKYRKYQKRNAVQFFQNPELPLLIFIGRLSKKKKLDLLISAVNNLNNATLRFNLLIVGDGAEKENLEEIGRVGIQNKWIKFYGAKYSEVENGISLSVADLCISPGNIGLTAIHSLSFGTPVCTHNNFKNQGPEVEAITDGYNGILFEENSVKDLCIKIDNWFCGNYKERNVIRERCYEIIDKYYNPEYQLNVIERMIRDQKPLI